MSFTRAFDEFTFASPVTGNSLLAAMPGVNDVFLILSVYTTLTTDANVANRRLVLRMQDAASNTISVHSSPVDQAASLGWVYNWTPRGADGTEVGTRVSLAIPYPLLSRSGHFMNIFANSFQAGDDIGETRVQVVRL